MTEKWYPDMTGIIFDLKKYAIHDGPGIRTTVFFKGCPLACWWCHNPEGRNPEPEPVDPERVRARKYVKDPSREGTIGYEVSVQYLLEEIEKDRMFYEQSGGGVTFSGGEPLMQVDFLSALLEGCRDAGMRTAVDTSGYAPRQAFERIVESVDLFLYDIKLIDSVEHIEYTGISNELILDNLAWLVEKGPRIVPRIPLIPGVTDTEGNLRGIARFLSALESIDEVDLLPYNTIAEDKFERYRIEARLGHLEHQSPEQLREAGALFEEIGCRVRYGG
jgi:pyruvate formate lyase activating enzyme